MQQMIEGNDEDEPRVVIGFRRIAESLEAELQHNDEILRSLLTKMTGVKERLAKLESSAEMR